MHRDPGDVVFVEDPDNPIPGDIVVPHE